MSAVRRALSIALAPEIVQMVCKVYIPVLFPLTFLVAVAALSLDRALASFTGGVVGAGLLPTPTRLAVAGVLFVVGVASWLWTYDALVRIGRGSPSPTAGRTQVLVTEGPYALCRNPSVWGKFLGFLAVGVAIDSFCFVFVLAPLLLVGSLVEKVWFQEPQLVEVFGASYERYRRDVPLFVPWRLLGARRSRA